MALKKNSVFAFKIKGRKIPVTGIVMDFGKEWILIRYVPVDYVLDGYCFIRRKYIKDFERGSVELFKESVFKAKRVEFDNDHVFPLDTLIDSLKIFHDKSVLIQFDLSDERVAYIGKIIELSDKSFTIKNLSTRGVWLDKQEYKIDAVRTIQVENDYLISLSAYAKSKSKKN